MAESHGTSFAEAPFAEKGSGAAGFKARCHVLCISLSFLFLFLGGSQELFTHLDIGLEGLLQWNDGRQLEFSAEGCRGLVFDEDLPPPLVIFVRLNLKQTGRQEAKITPVALR